MTIQARLYVNGTPLQGSQETQAALATLFMLAASYVAPKGSAVGAK